MPLAFMLVCCAAWPVQDKVLLKLERSVVTFVSDAPMERITAVNRRSSGLLDPRARTFAVQVPIAEFQGFNSPLQREHFNENYMVTSRWPKATFHGRIIEAVDLDAVGEHDVRAKGVLTIRGIERERIVHCRLIVAAEGVRVTTTFEVPLEDHDIRIPRVVGQKIAKVVEVKVDAVFARNPSAR